MTRRAFTTLVSILLLVLYLFWWLWMRMTGYEGEFQDYYADTYGILAGFGGLTGLIVSRKWGYLQSYVGKSLVFLSLGLLCQFLGQLSYTALYYVYHLENAYPAFGEVFFLVSIPLYILGIWNLAKASGISISLRSFHHKFSALIFPVIMIGLSYSLFLRDYPFSDTPILLTFLDFFYPLGQALFVSLALLTFYLTQKVLGGVMRNRVVFILFALVFQYVADTMFIYETRSDLWMPGGNSDLLFVISYFLMTQGLISFSGIEKELGKS